jgi:hypothetical protein
MESLIKDFELVLFLEGFPDFFRSPQAIDLCSLVQDLLADGLANRAVELLMTCKSSVVLADFARFKRAMACLDAIRLITQHLKGEVAWVSYFDLEAVQGLYHFSNDRNPDIAHRATCAVVIVKCRLQEDLHYDVAVPTQNRPLKLLMVYYMVFQSLQ